MDDSDSLWQRCRARNKVLPVIRIKSNGVFLVAKIGSLADGSCSNIPKKKQCRGDSPVRRSPATFERNTFESRACCPKMCSLVQNSIREVGPFKNGDSIESPISVIQDHVSSSEANSNTMLVYPLGIEGENPVEDPALYQKKQAPKSRVGRRGGKAALNSLLVKGSGEYTACNREKSVEASSSCSISKVVAQDRQLHNGEIRNLKLTVGSDTSSSYKDLKCQPRASKRAKRDQSLVSETGKSPLEIESQKAESEILFPGLHLLADVAGFPENSMTEEKGIRKAIFSPTGVPFLQKRVRRRATSAFKRYQPYARHMLHDLEKNLCAADLGPFLKADNISKLGGAAYMKQSENQAVGNGVGEEQKVIPQSHAQQIFHDLEKNLSLANSEALLTVDNIWKLGEAACIKQSENQAVGNGVDEEQMVIPQSRCSRRSRSQALPSKYRDSVLQPWKRGTRR